MASLFFPQKNGGGPTVSIKNLVDAISDNYDISIISKNHEINKKIPLDSIKDGWNFFGFGNVYYFGYGKNKTVSVLNVIRDIRPDIIYQNSFFSHDDLIPVLIYKKFLNKEARIIITPRGEFQDNALSKNLVVKRLYIIFLKLFSLLRKAEWQVADYNEIENLSRFIGISKESIYVIPNLSKISKKDLIITKKKKGSLRVVFISRIHPHKNLFFILESLKKIKGEIIFDIYGSIEDEEYWERCKREIIKLPKNIECQYVGYIDNRLIAETLEKYHILYLPSWSEAYGQIIVEALLAKTPVLISDQTPWTDINDFKAGFAIDIEDKALFAKALEGLIAMDNNNYKFLARQASDYINNKLDFDSITKRYNEMFLDL
jgi:glycosyltransferase involved in cell wall biosynthesis